MRDDLLPRAGDHLERAVRREEERHLGAGCDAVRDGDGEHPVAVGERAADAEHDRQSADHAAAGAASGCCGADHGVHGAGSGAAADGR